MQRRDRGARAGALLRRLHLMRGMRYTLHLVNYLLSAASAEDLTPRNHHQWLAVTSLNPPLVAMHYAARNKGFILNHPIPIPLHAYFDAFDGDGELPALQNVRYINLTIAQPWAHEYIVANLTRGSLTQQAYSVSNASSNGDGSSSSFRFKECWATATASTSMKQWPTGPQKAASCKGSHCRRTDGWCYDMILIFKVAAFYDAVTTTRAKRVLWMDSDSFFQRAPDARFFEWMGSYDVATIFRFWPQYCPKDAARPWLSGCNPETGVVAFSVTPAARQLVEDMRNVYYHYDEQAYDGLQGLNDINFFKYLLNNGGPHGKLQPDLRVGRFAVGCRPKVGEGAERVKWLYDARWYTNTGVDCVGDQQHPNVAPFNLFEYVTHCKGSGPQRQSTANKNPSLLNHC